MSVRSDFGCKYWSIEFLLGRASAAPWPARATKFTPHRAATPSPPRTPPLNTANHYRQNRFFIYTCHNKEGTVRYRSRLVMFCLSGGFSWGTSVILGCHLWSTVWGLLYFHNSGNRPGNSMSPNVVDGGCWYFFFLYMLISIKYCAFFPLRLVFAFVRGLKPPKNTFFWFLGQKSWFLDFPALCGENSQP